VRLFNIKLPYGQSPRVTEDSSHKVADVRDHKAILCYSRFAFAAKGSDRSAVGRFLLFFKIANNGFSRESFRRNEVTSDLMVRQAKRDAAVKKLMDDLGFGHSFIPGL
jgi:hypothetical protein